MDDIRLSQIGECPAGQGGVVVAYMLRYVKLMKDAKNTFFNSPFVWILK